MNSSIQYLYQGLVALTEEHFPKQCQNCGKIYKTAEEYVETTEPVRRGSGLQAFDPEAKGKPVVNLYRNCACGSTLMSVFGDRRDSSEHGTRYREMFTQLLDKLEREGMERKTAHAELLNVMHGGGSPELAKFGIVHLHPAQGGAGAPRALAQTVGGLK